MNNFKTIRSVLSQCGADPGSYAVKIQPVSAAGVPSHCQVETPIQSVTPNLPDKSTICPQEGRPTSGEPTVPIATATADGNGPGRTLETPVTATEAQSPVY